MAENLQPRGEPLPQPIEKIEGTLQLSFESLPKFGNPALPLLWIDSVTISLRAGDEGEPESATLRFYSMLPEAAIENIRVQVSVRHLKKMLDVFSQTINYYPTKPATEDAK